MTGLTPSRFSQSHDACGIGFIARYRGGPTHEVLRMALEAVANHSHRGAVGADGKTGDGAGIMTQVPHGFMSRVYSEIYGHDLPPASDLAVGMVFLPLSQAGARSRCRRVLEDALRQHGLVPLGWRDVPVELDALGTQARKARPQIQQIFVGRGEQPVGDPFEKALYLARRRAERELSDESRPHDGFYVASLSHRTLVYKGLCMAEQLGNFYPDLVDPTFVTSVGLFHQRYSTNTIPAWKLAHPFHMIGHNGEFNTLRGNWSRMRARETALPTLDEAAAYLTPIIGEGVSDSGAFDNVLEYLVRCKGSELLPSLLMMIPEMWENIPAGDIPPKWRSLYGYQSCLMDPWDGPAAVAFFDGRVVGTILDRNGLRPVRYTLIEDHTVISASEAGAVEVDEERVVRRGQLGPGEIFVVDLEAGCIFTNHELKTRLAQRQPYARWVEEHVTELPEGVFYGQRESDGERLAAPSQREELHRRKLVFGFNREDEVATLKPMVTLAHEPLGSMGDDTPPAVLARVRRPLFHYFRQRFAQVTNPATDSIRERVVMSLRTLLGRSANILTEVPETTNLLEVPGPILSEAAFQHISTRNPRKFPKITLRSLWAVHGGAKTLREDLDILCRDAETAVRQGAVIVILYDGEINAFRAPIPSLLAVSAVHQHLTSCGLRLGASLIVASGEPREVHHFACLLGFGADAIYPFLAYDTITALVRSSNRHFREISVHQAHLNFIHSVEKGLLKIMGKIGISLLSGYRGAQVFEALGISSDVMDRYFPHAASHLGGAGLRELARTSAEWHDLAYAGESESKLPGLCNPGFYKYKKLGEQHRFSPRRVKALHSAVKQGAALLMAQPGEDPFETLRDGVPGYRALVELTEASAPIALRDLLGLVRHRPALEIAEVEAPQSIVRRFSTGAMSHGALSVESHRTLAIAMNRIGGASNSGEGGEGPERYGTEANSRIKQVASGRFGLTTAYLMSADELQIKIAQGSKPGEGGQIPGHKVTAEIARIRHTTPGIALISPPTHHDVYSIEDLAQLIYDLKRVNESAVVSVKLVSSDGVGTVASGVVKGYADVIHIGGADGGTGASSLSSIKFAGMPWELGLAETQQVLVKNGLRHLVRLRVDGGFLTGRDILLAAILGADEFAFGTAALLAEGCLMARVCHTNRCPVGIASQDPKLRKKFPGTPERVIAYMVAVAQEVRQLLADLGFRSLQEVIGCTELLEQVVFGEEAGQMDLSPLLWRPMDGVPQRHEGGRNRPPDRGRDLDQKVLRKIQPSLEAGWEAPLVLGARERIRIHNTDRSVGARIAGWMTQMSWEPPLQAASIEIRLSGSAGQSFGAFCVEGLKLDLEGVANDYVAKGMSGGEIVIRPSPRTHPLRSEMNSIVGNTVLYGATSGRLFAAGKAGQRFCVRNSGAVAVIEGVGEHACEYMTGGTVVVLGDIGRNFGAAMTGGSAFIYDADQDGTVLAKLNPDLIEATPLNETGRASELRDLVDAHYQATESQLAWKILDAWENATSLFWLVQPKTAAASIEAVHQGLASRPD